MKTLLIFAIGIWVLNLMSQALGVSIQPAGTKAVVYYLSLILFGFSVGCSFGRFWGQVRGK